MMRQERWLQPRPKQHRQFLTLKVEIGYFVTPHSNLYIYLSTFAFSNILSADSLTFLQPFFVHECLAEWEKILSNSFLYTDAKNLFYEAHLFRISMPSGKWVKIRVKFGISCVWESCLNKISKFLRFCDGIFRKQSLLLRKCLKIRVCGLLCLVHENLLNIPMYFLPRNYAPVSQTFVYKRTVLKKIWKFWKSKNFYSFEKNQKLVNGLNHTSTIFIFLIASF